MGMAAADQQQQQNALWLMAHGSCHEMAHGPWLKAATCDSRQEKCSTHHTSIYRPLTARAAPICQPYAAQPTSIHPPFTTKPRLRTGHLGVAISRVSQAPQGSRGLPNKKPRRLRWGHRAITSSATNSGHAGESGQQSGRPARPGSPSPVRVRPASRSGSPGPSPSPAWLAAASGLGLRVRSKTRSVPTSPSPVRVGLGYSPCPVAPYAPARPRP